MVGFEHVKQCISALEHQRFNHQHEDLYSTTPESQKPLRDDSRIKEYEKAARSREPQRIAGAQARKASGTSAGNVFFYMYFFFLLIFFPDNYTINELMRASIWCISTSDRRTAIQSLYIGVRDRAMLLVSTCTAFRGDNIRSLLWSDLFAREIPVPELGLDKSIMVCSSLQELAGPSNINTGPCLFI